MIKKRVEIGETAATISCEERYLQPVIDGIISARKQITAYGRANPDFFLSLEPMDPEPGAPAIIRRMCISSGRSGTGPMSCVAGAVAAAGVQSAIEMGSEHCVVDNGGDLAMILKSPVSVGILDSLESGFLPTVEVGPTGGAIIGICTSSGAYGHSISLGRADSTTVMARDPILADALATAACNACSEPSEIRNALRALQDFDEVIWAVAKIDGFIGTFGDMPRVKFTEKSRSGLTIHSAFRAEVPI
ncbi:MAG TPA: UPF0280 family protein [Euryarchaeota archaeon]|nr:UPF0280 family protein [Euryarchaeota archaeon]